MHVEIWKLPAFINIFFYVFGEREVLSGGYVWVKLNARKSLKEMYLY